MIYAFLAQGFEEVEALAVVDVLRRSGQDVKLISINQGEVVVGAHGIRIIADALFSETDFSDAQALFLPGGMPGAANLDAHQGLRELLKTKYEQGAIIAAICAAPLVLGHLGLTEGKTCTCYPGFESELYGAHCTEGIAEVDGNIYTACGPAASLELGYRLAERLAGKDTADKLREGMMYNRLMK